MQEIQCIVSGRVQLVMYRDFATRSARSLGLTGYVKNLPDGRVEALAQGEEAALLGFVERLHQGSLLSRVDNVEVQWREPGERFDTFSLIR